MLKGHMTKTKYDRKTFCRKDITSKDKCQKYIWLESIWFKEIWPKGRNHIVKKHDQTEISIGLNENLAVINK